MARSWGWAFFFKIQIHISQKEALVKPTKSILLVIR